MSATDLNAGQDVATEIAELERALAAAKERQRAMARARHERAIAEIRETVDREGIAWVDVLPKSVLRELIGGGVPPASRTTEKTGEAKAGKPRGVTKTGRIIQAKFRDLQGNEWTGRGLQPRWVKDALASGMTLDDLRID